ncbi:MAG: hypothetical protein ABIR46_02065 [Candidatus Saccharimonadales bacterium]
MGEFADKWVQELIGAKNESPAPFGDIDWEVHGPEIIEEAAKLKGVEAPQPGSVEHCELLDEIRQLADLEHDELTQNIGKW